MRNTRSRRAHTSRQEQGTLTDGGRRQTPATGELACYGQGTLGDRRRPQTDTRKQARAEGQRHELSVYAWVTWMVKKARGWVNSKN